MKQFLVLLFASQFLGVMSLFADSVTFRTTANFSEMIKYGKNGIIENVKASVGKETIEIIFEDGKKKSFKKSEVKSLKIRPVVWKSLEKDKKKQEEETLKAATEEKKRIEEATEKGTDFEPRAEEDQISPIGNAGLGLIPGYSGLYRTQNKVGGGIFTVLETAALINALDYLTVKKGAHKIIGNDLFGFYMFQTYSPGGTFGSIPSYYDEFGLTLLSQSFSKSHPYIGGVTGRTLVNQSGDSGAGQKFNSGKGLSLGILGALLITDAIVSYFSAASWNEGTYTGEKSAGFQKPTTKLGRFGRSFFIPGFGQLYAGEKAKGFTFLTLSALALGNALKAEQDVKKLVKNDTLPPGDTLILLTAVGGVPILDLTENKTLLYMKIFGDQARGELEHAVEKRNQAWSILGAIWAVNLVDAIWFSGTDKQTGLFFKPDIRYNPASYLAGNNSYYGVQLDYVFE